MKNHCLPLTLLLLSVQLHSQTIHGIWQGTLVNDSTHRAQNFELGLSEYRGKITGYTYTTFIDNDTFYYSIKRIRAERNNGKLVIEDEEMVANNFPERAAKGVKQTTVFPLINDSTIDITNGRWNTNQTKRYYSISGSATIREQEDDKQSDLLSHLQEANIRTDIAANKKKPDTVELNPANRAVVNAMQVDGRDTKSIAMNATMKSPDKKIVGNVPTGNKDNEQTGDQNTQPKVKRETVAMSHMTTEAENRNNKVEAKKINTAVNSTSSKPLTSTAKTDQAKSSQNNPVSTRNTLVKNEVPATSKDQTKEQPLDKPIVKTTPTVPAAENKQTTTSTSSPTTRELPAAVAVRKNDNMQDVYFRHDSLVLALYDNGIVDGDTVSVFLNGDPVISRQMLKAVATKKTVYIPASTDSIQLVLFAENLGSIPPNTGLLIIRDGDDSYQVRFSADFQKNASLVLRRKK